MSMVFSPKAQALAIIPKCTGIISFCCSFYIVQRVLFSPKKRSLTYHRLLLGMSISDMFGSFFGFFLSTWPMPRDSVPPIFGAVGTTETCTMAGFFNHAGNTCTPLYNGSLATYYLLMIVYRWNERQLTRIEYLFHAIPLIVGWGTAIAGIPLKLYNSANWICWIAPLPPGCKDSYTYGEEGNCIRGDNAWIYRWAFLYAEVWATILYVTIAMSVVYYSVLKQERAIDKYNLDGERKRTHSRKVANQGLLYVGAFLLTWIFGTLTRLLQLIQNKTYFPIIVLMTIFFPCQGLFNFLIYLRPRYLRYRQVHPEFTIWNMLSHKFTNSSLSQIRIRKSTEATLSQQSNPTGSGDGPPTAFFSEDIHASATAATTASETNNKNNNNNNKRISMGGDETKLYSVAELAERQRAITQVENIERHLEIEELE